VFLLAFGPGGYLIITETKYALFCALSGLFLLALVFLGRTDHRRFTLSTPLRPIAILIAAFWLCCVVSALCSPWRVTALLGGNRQEGLITITIYCGICLALAVYGEYVRLPMWLPACSLGVLCVVAVLQFLDLNPLGLYPDLLRWSGREKEYNGAFLSLTGNADLTASVLCTGFSFLWPYGLRARKWWAVVSAVLCLAVIVASGIRSGLVGAATSLLICLTVELVSSRKSLRYVFIIPTLLFAGLIIIWLCPMPGEAGEIHNLLNGHISDDYGSGRVFIWRNVLKLIQERPILGGGPDTLGERGLAFVKVFPDGLELRRVIDCAHSEPLNVMANEGILAFVILVSALTVTLARAFRSESNAVAALRSAMIGYIGCSLFGIAMPANAVFFWIIWGMMLAKMNATSTHQRFNAV